MAPSHLSRTILLVLLLLELEVLELVAVELASSSLGDFARGAGSGTVGGVFACSRHHPKMHVISGKGLEFLFFFLDCSLFISAMISSTGRSAGHGGVVCANINALTMTVANAHGMRTN
jgi:hypothetical protein